MLKTVTHTMLGATLLAASTLVAPSDAQARGGRGAGAVAGAIIGLGILGAYAASRERDYYYRRSCYPGREVCDVVGQRCWHNRYGERVCKDRLRCYRPTVCD